jgi:hypothetical protein
VGTATVNQQNAPDDFTASGASWEELGASFPVSQGTLRVVLSDDVDSGDVVADAVLIEAVAPATTPEIAVMDGTTEVLDETGTVDLGTVLVGTEATRTFSVKNLGGGQLTLNSPALPAGFALVHDLGSTALAGGEATTFTVSLDTAQIATYSGSIAIENCDADENPFNFAIRAVVAEQPPPAPQIIDDGDAGFYCDGFQVYHSSRGYQSDVRYSPQGTGSRSAIWESDVPAGTYRVAATWYPQAGRRPSNAPYSVYDCDPSGSACTLVNSVSINQQVYPQSFTAEGQGWEVLAAATEISNGRIRIVLTDDVDTGDVVADAVWIEPLSLLSSVSALNSEPVEMEGFGEGHPPSRLPSADGTLSGSAVRPDAVASCPNRRAADRLPPAPVIGDNRHVPDNLWSELVDAALQDLEPWLDLALS